MCRRIRRSTQIHLSSSSPFVRHERQSLRMGSALRKRLRRLRTDTPQKRRMRLRKIHQQLKNSNPRCATKPRPENDRIYFDCLHATAILIIAIYVDDNLAFTNCAALAAEFEVHCNVKFPMNVEGPINWYLSVKYDCDPTTGAVSAHQHLYIDKLLKKWGMEQCNPLPPPFPQKADDFVTYRNSRQVTHQRIPSTGW